MSEYRCTSCNEICTISQQEMGFYYSGTHCAGGSDGFHSIKQWRSDCCHESYLEINHDIKWVPETPGGTLCDWLAADTEDQAWANLVKDAAHLTHDDKQGFINRGYTVEEWEIETI